MPQNENHTLKKKKLLVRIRAIVNLRETRRDTYAWNSLLLEFDAAERLTSARAPALQALLPEFITGWTAFQAYVSLCIYIESTNPLLTSTFFLSVLIKMLISYLLWNMVYFWQKFENFFYLCNFFFWILTLGP